ncbi:MAG: ATP-binding cassette domain-containing protein [Proteobacteria bacterium]|nr:ATP-binding cassette domain-containing protein [Pseudomonadota bacterium]
MAAPLIEFRSVDRARGDGFRLNIARFTLGAGERVAIVGPSGAGKSTCLDLIAMSLKPDTAGEMTVTDEDGRAADVAALWRRDDRGRIRALRARRFGYVLQTGGLAPFLSLHENAMLSRRLLGMAGAGPVPALFERLGIADLARRKPRHVSIGERQRAAVVRALAHEPALVLADEPTASLDPANAAEVMALLTGTASDAGAALILVTHDRELAAAFGLPLAECRPDPATRVSTIAHGAP